MNIFLGTLSFYENQLLSLKNQYNNKEISNGLAEEKTSKLLFILVELQSEYELLYPDYMIKKLENLIDNYNCFIKTIKSEQEQTESKEDSESSK